MILVVDDYQDLCTLLALMFRQAGFTVRYATCPLRALEMMRESKPSAVVLDDNMPEMNGLDLLRIMRGDAALADIPTVMYSAAAPPERMHEAKRLGVLAWIPKNGKFNALRDTVRAAVA